MSTSTNSASPAAISSPSRARAWRPVTGQAWCASSTPPESSSRWIPSAAPGPSDPRRASPSGSCRPPASTMSAIVATPPTIPRSPAAAPTAPPAAISSASAASGTPALPAIASATVVQSITLRGNGLTGADRVLFTTADAGGTQSLSGLLAPTSIPDGTSLQVVVPDNAVSGLVRLARETVGQFLQIVPTLTDVFDLSGAPVFHGGTLRLRGSGFTQGQLSVDLGPVSLDDTGPASGLDVRTDFGQANDTVAVVVPTATPTGPLRVRTPGGSSAAFGLTFTGIVAVAPSGTPADPSQPSAHPGQRITLQGSGFDLSTDVLFPTLDSGGTRSERLVRPVAVNSTFTELTVAVPLDVAVTGPVQIVGDALGAQRLLQIVPVLDSLDVTSVADDGSTANVTLRGDGFVEANASRYRFGTTLITDDAASSCPDVFGINEGASLTVPLVAGILGPITVATAGGESTPLSVGFTGLAAT